MNDPFDIVATTPLGSNAGALDAVQPVPRIGSSSVQDLPSLYGNEYTKGLRRGLTGMYGTSQAFGAQLVEPFSQRAADEMFADANRTLNFDRGLRPKVEKWDDVHGVGDFFQYGMGKAGEALPSTALSLGAGAIGGAAGLGLRALTGARAPLAFAAGTASMFAPEAGEAALTMHNDPEAMANTTPMGRLGLSSLKGGVNAALEFTPEALAARRAIGATRVRRGLVPALGAVGAGIGEAAAGEALTEGLQEGVGQLVHGAANPNRDRSGDIESMREAMLGGAFGGAGMGAVAGGVHALRSNIPEVPDMPELPAMDMEAGIRAGYKGAKFVNEEALPAAKRALTDIGRWVSDLGNSVDQTVKPSLQWSDAKDNDLQRLLKDPEVTAALEKIEADDEDAHNLVVTLHSLRNAPKRMESPRGKRILARLDEVFGPNAYERLSNIIQIPGKEDVSNVGPTQNEPPRNETRQVLHEVDDALDDETADEDFDKGGQEGFLNEVFPKDQLGVNKQILSDAFQNRAHYLYSGVGKDKTQADIPLKFSSDTLSPQEFMKLLTTRDFKTGDKPHVRGFNDKEIAYHTQKGYAELPISPMSLSMALSTTYKDQLGQLREGQGPQDPSRKADIFMSAMSTLLNEGIAITDAQGKKHHINVELGEGAEEAKPIYHKEGSPVRDRGGMEMFDEAGEPMLHGPEDQRTDKTGKPMVKRDLPDNLLLVHDKQRGEYTVKHHKAAGKKVFNRIKDEAMKLEREYLQKFQPHLNNDEMWEKTYKAEKRNAPFGSPRNKALYAVYKGRDKFHDKLKWNIRNTVASGVDAIKEDLQDRISGASDETGNPETLIDDMLTYIGSEGAHVPSSVRQLFKRNNVPLFSKETFTSDALKNKDGKRPHDYLLRDLEELKQEAGERYLKGVFSQTEQNEAVGEDAETANVPGIGNTVWNKGEAVKLHEGWKGSFNEPVTQKIKNKIIATLTAWRSYLQNNGKWRVESAGGKRAGFFKTKEEAQTFIDNLPKEGFRLQDADGKLYTLEQAKEKWPRWKDRLYENNLGLLDLSIVNPETGEVLELGGHVFTKLPQEVGVHYLNAMHKTLSSGGLKPVDATPMFTKARALPVDVQQNINEKEFSPEQLESFRREYGSGRRPLTEQDLEEKIPVVEAVEAGRAGGNKFLSTKPGTYNEGKAAATAESEGTKGVKPELRSRAATLQAIETNKAALEAGGITDDFGDRMLMQKPHQKAVVPVRTYADEKVEKDQAKLSKKEVEEEGVTDDFGNRIRVALPHQAEIEQELKDKAALEREARGEAEPKVLPRFAQPATAAPDTHAVSRKRAEEEDAADETDTDILRTAVTWFNEENDARKAADAAIAGKSEEAAEQHAARVGKNKNSEEAVESEILNAEEETKVQRDYDEMQLFLRGQLDADIARRAGEDRTYDPKAGMMFSESEQSSYRPRTRRNASADATIAIAADFLSGGERLTKSSTIGQNKKYIPINYNGEERATDEQVDEAVALLNEIPKKFISLNIAGNGIYTLKKLGNQEKVDAYTLDFLKRVMEHPELEKQIESVRTGGQTGFDEAGAKAARELGFPVEVHAPKGWTYRVIDETKATGYRDIENDEAGFKARFTRPEGQPYPVITPRPKVPSSPSEPLTRHETLDGLKASQKTKLAFTDNKGNIHLVIPNIAEDFKGGFHYMFGGAEHNENVTESAAQKKIMARQMGLTREMFARFVPTVEAYETFLQAHEQSHIDNNDRAKYPKHEDGSLDLLNKKAIDIERRATLDGLKAIQPTTAAVTAENRTVKRSDHIITRDEIKANPDTVYVYGDNLRRRGLGGQAEAARGEPNAIGVATKKMPATTENSYFTDDEFPENKKVIDEDFAKIPKDKHVVIMPLGEQRAELKARALKTYEYLQSKIRELTGEAAPAAPAAPTGVVRDAPMSFPMPADANVTGKATTTLQLVKDGVRTATTRHWSPLPKVGDVLNFHNRDKTDSVKVRVTSVGPRLGTLFEGKDKNAVLTELSKAEGWTPEAFIHHYNAGRTVNDDSRQITYERLDKPAAPAPAAAIAPKENIASNSSVRKTLPLGQALTNMTWGKYQIPDVPGLKKPDPNGRFRLSAEGWYKANSSNRGDLAYDMAIMQRVIEAKLRLKFDPSTGHIEDLVKAIDENGGAAWIAASDHLVNDRQDRWQGKGLNSNFIRVLHDAYNAVKGTETQVEETADDREAEREYLSDREDVSRSGQDVDDSEMNDRFKESRQTINTPGVSDQLKKVMERNGFVYDERMVDELPTLLNIASKTLNPKSMKQAAQGLSFLMVGHPDFQAILPEIQKTEAYARELAGLKGTQSRAHLEAARRVLASLIEQNLVDRNVPPTLLSKLLKLLQQVWNTFSQKVAPDLTKFVDSLVDKALGEEGYLTRPDKPGYEEINFQKAVNSDKLAGEILKVAAKSDAILTGSLAYAAQTKVYRPQNAAIHDLDFRVDSPAQAKSFIQNITKEFPEWRLLNNFYDGKFGVTTVLVPPAGTKIKELTKTSYIVVDAKTGEKVGSYSKTKDSEQKSGQQAKAVDVIVSNEQASEPTVTHNFKVDGEDVSLELASTQSGVAAKLRMLREKDVWDFQRYNPSEKPSFKESQQTQPTPGTAEYYVSDEGEDGFAIHENIAGEIYDLGHGSDELTGLYKTRAQAEAAIAKSGGVLKESQQAKPTPGWDPKRATRATITKRLTELAEKMFGRKIEVIIGTPPGVTSTSGARGWYESKSNMPQFKANVARIKEVRDLRRDALKAGNRAEVDKLNAEEASLLKQNEVVGTIYLNPSLANREMFPTYYHEALHAAFDVLLTPQEKAILANAFTRGTVRRQLENLFKDDPAVLAQMKDAEEAAAYGFQIYSAAPHLMQLGPKVEGMFSKVAKWFKKMLGALSPEEKAQIIMDEMLSGKRQETGLSPLQRLLDEDMTFQQKVAKHATALKELMQKLWEVVATPSYDRLIKTGIPPLAEIAKRGHTKTGDPGKLGMIQRLQNEMSANFNWINKFTKKYTNEQIAAVADHRMNGTMPTDPELVKAYRDIDTFFNEFRKYAQKAGVDVGFIKDYWPMLWDAPKVMKGRTEFLQMISQQKYASYLDDLKVTPTELWENISGYVTRGDTFQGIMSPTGEPVNAYSRERSLSFLDPDDRKPFMHDNPYETMVNYVSHMVRQAEFVRAYGANGEIKDALLLEAAEKYGATKDQLKQAHDYIDGLLGNKEVGMSRELKDLYGAAIVYQNYRLLPFNLFTSLVDPLGIAIRSGKLGDALEGFTYSLKKIFRDLKKDRPDDTKDFYERLAEDWGYIEDAGTMANLRHMMETTELRGFSKKMNDALFKWNLLNGWTRSTKIMAVKAAQRFIARSAQGTDKTSVRHLEELGLKPTDVIETEEGNIALRKDEFMAQGLSEADAEKAERRMRDAMTKFVNQAILNPVAADLPQWGSNPYLAPIFHLKQFMFAFQTTIMSRVYQEAKHGNLKPLWISGIYIPGMIAADAMRGFVSNMGDQPPWQKDWGPVDYVKNGVSRSGLLGSGQMVASMFDDVMHGGRGYESAIGPTAEQFMKGLQAVGKGDTALWNFTVKSMPLAPVYDQWLLSSKPGPMDNHFGEPAS